MKYSNTAIPKYYGEFRDKVIRGEIKVCKEVSMEMVRIDSLIDNPGVYYNGDAVEGWIEFCEGELTLTDGSDMELLDTFKLWGEQVYGWYYYIEKLVFIPGENGERGTYQNRIVRKRLTIKQYIILPRGGAKTVYLYCHQSYGLNIDGSTTSGVTIAPTMKQAEEVIMPMVTSIQRSKGPLYKFLTTGSKFNTSGDEYTKAKLVPNKGEIQNRLTNSKVQIRPMRIDKLQGLRCKYVTIDEWLSGDTREDPIGAVEQGASKLPDYLIVSTSSEGTIRNGVGDTIKMELMDILKGEYINPRVSIWYYKLDHIDEVGDPNMWEKAQPNIGLTVTYETYQADVERAEKSPSARNDILAKRFNLPMEGYTYFFTYEQTIAHRYRSYRSLPCAMGGDMSRGDDFCAFTFLFPLSTGEYGIKSLAFISEKGYANILPAQVPKYNEFIDEGSLIVMDGIVLNMDHVYDEVDKYIYEHGYDVRCFGYDPYNADEFLKRWVMDYGEYATEKVIQGARTESVPLGEIEKMADERLLLFDQAIFSYTMGNSVTYTDPNGNRKLTKNRIDQKIDCVSALVDAWVVIKKFADLF